MQQRQEERESQAKEAEGELVMLTHHELIIALTGHAHTSAGLHIMLSVARRNRRRPAMYCQLATRPWMSHASIQHYCSLCKEWGRQGKEFGAHQNMQRRLGRASALSLLRVQQTGLAWVSVRALRRRDADKVTVMRTGRGKAKAVRQSAWIWCCVGVRVRKGGSILMETL